MKVLAIDGALGAFSCAVADGDRIAGARSESGNVALERGLASVSELMSETGATPSTIDRLAVVAGPGGFTGLRIAIAYAKSLALAWNRPLVPISSFDALEYGRTLDPVLTIVVGRPGVISARLTGDGSQRRASGWIADVLHELFAAGGPSELTVVGAPKDVLAALAERARVVTSLDPLVTPAAAAAALAAVTREPAASAHAVRADYGELPAAKVPKLR